MNAFEMKILDFIQEHFACAFSDGAAPILSLLAEKGILFIALALVLMCFRKTRRTGMEIGLALLVGVIFGNVVLKNIVARPRPYMIDPEIKLLVERLTDYSFPSGHALASFEVAGVLTVRNKRFGIPALVVATLIAFSRLYLRVHFPTDVLGGILLGLGIAFLSCRLIGKVYRKAAGTKWEKWL